MTAQIGSNHPVAAAQEWNDLLKVRSTSTEAVQQYNYLALPLITVTNIASFTTNVFHDGFLLSM
ncbi:hypothetical protein D3C86_1753950 [compost metagenome]